MTFEITSDIQFYHSVVTWKLGKRMMMRDDMIELYPDVFKKFPRDIIMVNWQCQQNAVQQKGHFDNLSLSWSRWSILKKKDSIM